MAEMKISDGPLKLTLTDDKGRVVAALSYPKVKWQKLVIESEDAEFDAVVLGDTRVRLEKRAPASEDAAEGSTGDARPEWDPFHEVEFGVRDFLTKAGKAVEDFLDDLKDWSGPYRND
jgi:hypothetical protein